MVATKMLVLRARATEWLCYSGVPIPANGIFTRSLSASSMWTAFP